jgi:multidrug transporter EmrE-like cation transporter
LLDDESSPVYVEITQTLSAVGDYATLISDGFNGTYTGDYDLYLQRLNDPANAVSLSFGQTTSGEIAIPVEMDTYTFTADAGDTILIGMGLVSGDLWQRVRLYDPHGNLLNDGSSPVHVEITQTLPVAGAYTVLAGDGFNGTYTGSYNLYLQRLNDPAQAAPLSFGQTTSGEIAIPVEMDTYTFTANAGDTILIGMSRGSAKRLFLPLVLFNWSPTNVNAAISTRMRCVSGDLWQRIRLYDPDGNLLNDRSSPIHTEITQTLPVAGAYAILVGDGFNGTYTGEYSLHLQRLNNPGNVRSLSFGQTVSGTITMPAEMHAFAFAADAGDTVIIGMSRVFGDLWQRIRLYAPDGHLLSDESSPVHVEITHSLPVVGTYAILVNDGFNGTLMGHYTLNLQKLP